MNLSMYLRSVYTVFTQLNYLTLALLVAYVVFTLAVWLPNLDLIMMVLGTKVSTVMTKLSFLWSLYGSITTNFTVVSAVYTTTISVLFGVQVALLTYYVRRVRGGVRSIKTAGVTSLGGLISGIFGIGCAACGTFILTSVLTLFGVTGFLTFLPFGGEEFGVIGVFLLLYAIGLLLKKIAEPKVCLIT
jgi:hypothetical protein